MAATFIIAEAGVNHDGELERALALVDAAAAAGADAVKFQTFRPDALAARGAPKAGYQRANDGPDGDQLAMLARLALDEAAHQVLVARARERRIQFLSSPFDSHSARFLCDTLELALLKLGSGEITNGPLLLQLARSGRPLLLSTGMSTLDEVRDALAVVAFGYLERDAVPSHIAFERAFGSSDGQRQLRERVRLLHCTSAYPCRPEEVNLRAMETLAQRFGLPVGLSDHSDGIAVATAAVARGACVIEKHFTLDRNRPGPDHKASLEPDQLAALVTAIRTVEQALGSGDKRPQASERETARVARKSLVATRPIAAGEPFTPANLGAKRPGTGLSPMRYWELLGTPATRPYAIDQEIAP